MLRVASILLILALVPTSAAASRLSPSIERRSRVEGAPKHSVVGVERQRRLVERGFLEYEPKEVATPSIDPFSGDLFVGTRDGMVRLFDSMGRTIWERNLGSPPVGHSLITDASIHLGTANGLFWSLDRFSGEVLWSIQLKAQVLSRPGIEFGMLVVGTNQDEVHAIDQETGETVWVYRRSTARTLTIRGGAGVTVDDGRVFAGFSDGGLVSLGLEDGRLIWQVAMAPSSVLRFPDADASPKVSEGMVYATVFNDGVYAFDAGNGAIRWRHEAQGAHSLTLAGDLLLVGGGKRVLALSPESGARQWSASIGSSYVTEPVVAQRIVFVAGPEGLRMLEAKTGRPLGIFQPGSGFDAAPVAREDRVWALSNLGILYDLRIVTGEGS